MDIKVGDRVYNVYWDFTGVVTAASMCDELTLEGKCDKQTFTVDDRGRYHAENFVIATD